MKNEKRITITKQHYLPVFLLKKFSQYPWAKNRNQSLLNVFNRKKSYYHFIEQNNVNNVGFRHNFYSGYDTNFSNEDKDIKHEDVENLWADFENEISSLFFELYGYDLKINDKANIAKSLNDKFTWRDLKVQLLVSFLLLEYRNKKYFYENKKGYKIDLEMFSSEQIKDVAKIIKKDFKEANMHDKIRLMFAKVLYELKKHHNKRMILIRNNTKNEFIISDGYSVIVDLKKYGACRLYPLSKRTYCLFMNNQIALNNLEIEIFNINSFNKIEQINLLIAQNSNSKVIYSSNKKTILRINQVLHKNLFPTLEWFGEFKE